MQYLYTKHYPSDVYILEEHEIIHLINQLPKPYIILGNTLLR